MRLIRFGLASLSAWILLAGQEKASWSGFSRDAQHDAISSIASQAIGRIRWQTPVDLAPQYEGTALLIHYGSPLVTAGNTVLVPVKTDTIGTFQVEARNGSDGSLKWSLLTDYTLPPHDWVPIFGPVLGRGQRLYFPGAGGTVYYRDDPDAEDGAVGQIAFYGLDNYLSARSTFDANVIINTPLTADRQGNVYFGFVVFGDVPLGLAGGIARIGADGTGTWISAAAAVSDPAIGEVVTNSALALSPDGSLVYAAVSDGLAGYLVALDSTNLTPRAWVGLIDPATGLLARLNDNGSASPSIGPDGDVYIGVLESSFENHDRGWLLHFDAGLAQSKTPGAFGWDTTASVVPVVMAPAYNGASPYLLMTKYNDYIEGGGSGFNRIAILDPNDSEPDPVTGVAVMKVVQAVAAPTPDGPPPAVKEWCINSAAVDPGTGSILAGNSDGLLYRWDLRANTLTERIVLTPGLGEAYTPTLIGADGTVYAINNATLFAVGP